MNVPLLDLKEQNATLRPEIEAALARVLDTNGFILGNEVAELECELAGYCGVKYAIGCASGSDAILLALMAYDIGAGDEVITTPYSFFATVSAITRLGATPVFVDVDPVTRNIDLEQLAARITPQTKAIIPVDLAGLPVDRDRLYAIAEKHSLRVIEDAAQSFGSTWNGQRIGTGQGFVAFSFHANKNITTGEGGALVLPEDIDSALCERLRLQGFQRFADGSMDVDVLGGKFNLTDIAAAIGLGQLKRLDEFTARRRALVQRYFAGLDPALGLQLPLADFVNSNWHMFQVLLPEGTGRGAFIAGMREKGIGIGVHYPALHLFSLYRAMGFKPGDFPQAERIGAATVTLPLFPAMQDADVDRVCAALRQLLT